MSSPGTFPETSLSAPCPACSALIEERFNYCPFCGQMARLVCASCHSLLQEAWTWCPTCGLRITPVSVSIPTRVIPGAVDEAMEPRSGSEAEDYNQRGVELYEAERYDEAIAQFRRALALDPANSLYHCNLAVAYGESGDNAHAFQEYERALELNPSDVTALLNLGYAYTEQDQGGKARHVWERLVDIAPESPEAEEARDNLSATKGV